MSKNTKYFLGLPFIASLILCFFFGWIMGIIHRFMKGSILMGVLNIFFGFAFWIADIVSLIVKKDVVWLI